MLKKKEYKVTRYGEFCNNCIRESSRIIGCPNMYSEDDIDKNTILNKNDIIVTSDNSMSSPKIYHSECFIKQMRKGKLNN